MPTNAPLSAKPSKVIFDPFNSSATGHQRAENRLGGSTSWRDSRTLKLQEQFSSGAGGGKRLNDTVGAGSLDFGLDGRTENGGWERGAKGLRAPGQQSIFKSMAVQKDMEPRPAKCVKRDNESPKKPSVVVNPFTPFRKENGSIRETSWPSHHSSPSDWLEPIDPVESLVPSPPPPTKAEDEESPLEAVAVPPRIFNSLAFYINGSTAPYSDHKIKHMVSSHGGRISVALSRRTVTHVIVSRPNSSGGCGGGLAGSKIQKEIARVGGKAVKYVTAEWIVESVKAGKRLPESRFEAIKVAPKGVPSVASIFQDTGSTSKRR